ncbi:MAG: MBL fold metallo-hydrolase [Leptolyngbya foveolarum]|uniref:MBL fold metallo-hydrolase n=1 Tax=Leptolyngbya foveolarum TaxID=47253 RepID=A0A2W4WKI6_9CYAN|nr:MAG: MBL fold metallo-hydrolase [Leptolyngbya foveolarum]
MIDTVSSPVIQRPQGEATLRQESSLASQFAVKFWGVRGSVPTPTSANQRYGGNTICVEALIGDQHIIFDGGTGLVSLGYSLQQQPHPIHAHCLFTHTQWDRIQGFPFFQPAFVPHNSFSIHGGTAPNGASIKHCLTDQMLKPHFSMPMKAMRANFSFNTVIHKDSFRIADVVVETLKINDNTEAMGYRLTWQNKTLVYATDTPSEPVSREFLQFVDQADICIYDGTYSDLTYLKDQALDSSLQPWEIGAEIAQAANVKELILLHHSPIQSDDRLDQIQSSLRDRHPNVSIAREGMTRSL